MDTSPDMPEEMDWENESNAPTLVDDDAEQQSQFGDNDYGVPYVPSQPSQPANASQHLADGFWVGPSSDEEGTDEDSSPVNDENIPPPNTEVLGVPWVGNNVLIHEPAELSAANVFSMATELGLTNRDAFMRLVLDDDVISIVSWLVQQDFGNQVDLLDFAGWLLARRAFLVGIHNATEMLGLSYTAARQPGVTDFTAAAISSAFEQMETRRRELGIEGWGSMSLKWRVCYAVLQLYLGAGVEMAHDLATREAGEENWSEANRNRMEVTSGAVMAYAEMMCEEREYDPMVVQNRTVDVLTFD